MLPLVLTAMIMFVFSNTTSACSPSKWLSMDFHFRDPQPQPRYNIVQNVLGFAFPNQTDHLLVFTTDHIVIELRALSSILKQPNMLYSLDHSYIVSEQPMVQRWPPLEKRLNQSEPIRYIFSYTSTTADTFLVMNAAAPVNGTKRVNGTNAMQFNLATQAIEPFTVDNDQRYNGRNGTNGSLLVSTNQASKVYALDGKFTKVNSYSVTTKRLNDMFKQSLGLCKTSMDYVTSVVEGGQCSHPQARWPNITAGFVQMTTNAYTLLLVTDINILTTKALFLDNTDQVSKVYQWTAFMNNVFLGPITKLVLLCVALALAGLCYCFCAPCYQCCCRPSDVNLAGDSRILLEQVAATPILVIAAAAVPASQAMEMSDYSQSGSGSASSNVKSENLLQTGNEKAEPSRSYPTSLSQSQNEQSLSQNKKSTLSRGYRASPSQSYRAAPSQSYRPTPSQSYRDTLSRSYRAAPSQSYRASPSQSYRPAPSQNYRASPSRSYRAKPLQCEKAEPSRSYSNSLSQSHNEPSSQSKKATPSRSYRAKPLQSKKASLSRSTKATPSRSYRATPTKSKKAEPLRSYRAALFPCQNVTLLQCKKGTPSRSENEKSRSKRATPSRSYRAKPSKSKKAEPSRSNRANPLQSKKAEPSRSYRITLFPSQNGTLYPCTKKATPSRSNRSTGTKSKKATTPSRSNRATGTKSKKATPSRSNRKK